MLRAVLAKTEGIEARAVVHFHIWTDVLGVFIESVILCVT